MAPDGVRDTLMRIIIDAPDADDQPTPDDVQVLIDSYRDLKIGVNDAGHGNVLIQRLRDAGIPCERWFRASCGLRKKAE